MGVCGRVQANKRVRKRSGVGGHRPETATFPPSLAGWPFSQGFDSNLTMIFTRRSPQLLPPLHTISGGSTPTKPLQPIRQDHRDNWPACILYLFRRGYLAKIIYPPPPRKSKNLLKKYSFLNKGPKNKDGTEATEMWKSD